MSRYIDADTTLKRFKEVNGNESEQLNCCDADWVVSFIETQPTADVREISRGRWELIGKNVSKCTVCGCARNIRTQIGWNFCPVCGAKMDLKD